MPCHTRSTWEIEPVYRFYWLKDYDNPVRGLRDMDSNVDNLYRLEKRDLSVEVERRLSLRTVSSAPPYPIIFFCSRQGCVDWEISDQDELQALGTAIAFVGTPLQIVKLLANAASCLNSKRENQNPGDIEMGFSDCKWLPTTDHASLGYIFASVLSGCFSRWVYRFTATSAMRLTIWGRSEFSQTFWKRLSCRREGLRV